MAIDPARPESLEPGARAADELADLRRRVRALESAPTIRSGNGAPAISAANLREGTPYLDNVNNRLYIVVAGVWRYVTLT